MRSHAQTHLNAQTHARALMQSSPCPLKSRDSFLVPRDSIAAAREMFTAINPLLIRHSPAWDAHNSSRQSVTEPWAPLPPPARSPFPALPLPFPFPLSFFPLLFPSLSALCLVSVTSLNPLLYNDSLLSVSYPLFFSIAFALSLSLLLPSPLSSHPLSNSLPSRSIFPSHCLI